MYFEEPEDIILNFVRSRITELVRRNKDDDANLANRQTADSQTFNPSALQTDLVLTNTPVSIVNITVDGSPAYAYQEYNIDLDNKTIKFNTGFVGTEEVIVNYFKGSDWVFPDKPRDDLKRDSYPRIACIQLTENPDFIELGSTETNEIVSFQFDILAYKDQTCIIDTEKKEGVDVVNYLARKIINAFKDYWVSDVLYVIRDIDFISNEPIPFDEILNIFRRTVDIQFTFRNMRKLTS